MKRKKCGSISVAPPQRRPRLPSPRARSAAKMKLRPRSICRNISRPGDVLKAITQQKEAVAPPVRPAAVPPVAASPVAVPAPPAARPTPPPAAPSIPARKLPRPLPGPTVVTPAEKPAVAATPAAPPSAPTVPPPPPPVVPVSAYGGCATSSHCAFRHSFCAAVAHGCATSGCARGPPQPPAPRMIVPQTGPRPVYKAPPPHPVAPSRQARAADPGVPSERPAPGRPVPGQPIFQRPRPQCPAEVRRARCVRANGVPCIPRGSPAGARPLGVGPGLPPPGPARPGSRPGVPRAVPDSATSHAGSKKAR